MRGAFDEQEQEDEPRPRDTEVTLGWGTVLIAFFGLVVLCCLSFEWGYMTGQRGTKTATTVDTTTTPADQEPLQPKGAVPKPSASEQEAAEQPADTAPQAPAETAPQAQADTSPAAPAQEPAPTAAPPQVHAALPSGGNATESHQAEAPVRPALPTTGPFMVQIAAIANPADADVLVNALRKRNYVVSEQHEAGDNLIHVRVGPFGTLAEAEQWEMKLLNDGYNAVVQP